MIVLDDFEPYRGRSISLSRRVEVYRNLNRPGGPWYSIRQDGRVVGHARKVTLRRCQFVVRESGRRRVLKTGRKNVHAWVLGYIDFRYKDHEHIDLGEPKPVRYNPRTDERFMMFNEQGSVPDGWEPITVAMKASLDDKGLRVWMKRA